MRCSRCKKYVAKYIVEYAAGTDVVEEYLCEACYAQNGEALPQAKAPVSGVVCSFCGNAMEDYLHSGLVGCAQCYTVFAQELEPYVIRLQGNGEHRGKEYSKDPKYEAAQSLRELLLKQKKAAQSGNTALASKLGRNIDELKLLLFGVDEEE
ncbi:MAG: hypothetical protein IJY26_00095 [Clostridia bacterium]|nr:hypothetical protein [Clostridia bacterium]